MRWYPKIDGCKEQSGGDAGGIVEHLRRRRRDFSVPTLLWAADYFYPCPAENRLPVTPLSAARFSLFLNKNNPLRIDQTLSGSV